MCLHRLRLIWANEEEAFAGVNNQAILMKLFEYATDIRFQKIYNFRKILPTNVGSGIMYITGKINVIVNKNMSTVNIVRKMGPKIDPGVTLKSIF